MIKARSSIIRSCHHFNHSRHIEGFPSLFPLASRRAAISPVPTFSNTRALPPPHNLRDHHRRNHNLVQLLHRHTLPPCNLQRSFTPKHSLVILSNPLLLPASTLRYRQRPLGVSTRPFQQRAIATSKAAGEGISIVEQPRPLSSNG